MIWAKEKTITALVGEEAEELKARFRVPDAIEWNELIEEYENSVPWHILVLKFGIEADGFASMDELVHTPGTGPLVALIGSQVLASAVPTVTLKNGFGSSTV